MPLQTQIAEIPLGGTFDQSKGELIRGPNALAAIANGDHDKQGYLVKARGFVRIPLTNSINGVSLEDKFVAVGIDRDELVLVGQRHVYSVMATDEIVNGYALVHRGRSMVGNFRVGIVHTTGISE